MTTARTDQPPRGLRDISRLQRRFEDASASEVLSWGFDTYGGEIAIASSFGPEDIVLVDLAASIDPDVRVFTLDTGRLPEETHDLIDEVRDFFGIQVEVVFPEHHAVAELVRENGTNGFYHSIDARKACCHVRKVEPLRRMLQQLKAWITGVRRDQNVTRAGVAPIELDLLNGGITKLNPLASWSSEDVWNHIRKRGLPYNDLHDRGYPSIGCRPCTRAVEPGEDERAGRWWWERADQKECGLHAGKNNTEKS